MTSTADRAHDGWKAITEMTEKLRYLEQQNATLSSELGQMKADLLASTTNEQSLRLQIEGLTNRSTFAESDAAHMASERDHYMRVVVELATQLTTIKDFVDRAFISVRDVRNSEALRLTPESERDLRELILKIAPSNGHDHDERNPTS